MDIFKKFSALLSKTTPVDNDSLVGVDSQDGNKLKLFSLSRIARHVLGNRSIGESSSGDVPEDSVMTTNSSQNVREKAFDTTNAYQASGLGSLPGINTSGVHISGSDGKLKKMALYLFRRLLGAGHHIYTIANKDLEPEDSITLASSTIVAALGLQGALFWPTVKVSAFKVLAGDANNPTQVEQVDCHLVINRPSNDTFNLEITPDISAICDIVVAIQVTVTD